MRCDALRFKSSWGGSSAGRASRSQCEGREFDPPPLHHNVRKYGPSRPVFLETHHPPSGDALRTQSTPASATCRWASRWRTGKTHTARPIRQPTPGPSWLHGSTALSTLERLARLGRSTRVRRHALWLRSSRSRRSSRDPARPTADRHEAKKRQGHCAQQASQRDRETSRRDIQPSHLRARSWPARFSPRRRLDRRFKSSRHSSISIGTSSGSSRSARRCGSPRLGIAVMLRADVILRFDVHGPSAMKCWCRTSSRSGMPTCGSTEPTRCGIR